MGELVKVIQAIAKQLPEPKHYIQDQIMKETTNDRPETESRPVFKTTGRNAKKTKATSERYIGN